MVSNRDLAAHNVLFVTIDCCRYDTLRQAQLPFLKSLGRFREARTHGTYTLPAHMSFFMGYLPSVISEPYQAYYSSEVRQLWRLASGRACPKERIGIEIHGDNIIDGYRRRGFRTLGAGGVRWFRHPLLQGIFDRFLFYGSSDERSVFAERGAEEFPLNHIDDLLSEIGDSSFFLFINCPETHVPYDFGEGEPVPGARRIIEAFSGIWGFKKRTAEGSKLDFSDLTVLHTAQVEALQRLDKKLKRLTECLSRPLLIVICGDHGECFGEDRNWGHGYAHPKVLKVPLLIAHLD